MRRMAILLRPFDRFVLGLEGGEDMIGMVLNNVILDSAARGTTLWPCLNEYVRRPAFHYIPFIPQVLLQAVEPLGKLSALPVIVGGKGLKLLGELVAPGEFQPAQLHVKEIALQ
jgi:hypothetical protein